jgi:hypothetical protein
MSDRNPMDIRMDAATDEAHTAIVNFEPTYLALGQAVADWTADMTGPIAPYRDQLRDTVETLAHNAPDFDGIDWAEVDFASMIDWEVDQDDNDRIGGATPEAWIEYAKDADRTVIPELDLDTVDLLVREANRGLMVMFINHNLLERANLDVRSSVVFFDDRHMFEYAMAEMPDEDMQRKLLAHTTVRFWAKGV